MHLLELLEKLLKSCGRVEKRFNPRSGMYSHPDSVYNLMIGFSPEIRLMSNYSKEGHGCIFVPQYDILFKHGTVDSSRKILDVVLQDFNFLAEYDIVAEASKDGKVVLSSIDLLSELLPKGTTLECRSDEMLGWGESTWKL